MQRGSGGRRGRAARFQILDSRLQISDLRKTGVGTHPPISLCDQSLFPRGVIEPNLLLDPPRIFLRHLLGGGVFRRGPQEGQTSKPVLARISAGKVCEDHAAAGVLRELVSV